MSDRTYKPGDEVMVKGKVNFISEIGEVSVRLDSRYIVNTLFRPDQLLPVSPPRDAIADAAIAEIGRAYMKWRTACLSPAEYMTNEMLDADDALSKLTDAYLSGAAQ